MLSVEILHNFPLTCLFLLFEEDFLFAQCKFESCVEINIVHWLQGCGQTVVLDSDHYHNLLIENHIYFFHTPIKYTIKK